MSKKNKKNSLPVDPYLHLPVVEITGKPSQFVSGKLGKRIAKAQKSYPKAAIRCRVTDSVTVGIEGEIYPTEPLPRIHWSGNEQAFRALKWFKPDAVRLIRAAFDNGSTERELYRLCKGPNADMVQAAITHMAADPDAGRVRWLADGQWDWDERRPTTPEP